MDAAQTGAEMLLKCRDVPETPPPIRTWAKEHLHLESGYLCAGHHARPLSLGLNSCFASTTDGDPRSATYKA
eukprot:1044091-Pelagomonas_calceolata.AAC.4